MKLALVEILLLHLISTTFCVAARYDCDQKNISCGCGFKNVDINEENNNNAEEAIPYSWSMMVSIRYDCHGNGDPFTHCCGGIILNDRHILTTARCLKLSKDSSLVPNDITIYAGIHRLSQNCQTIRAVEEWSIHPAWKPIDEAMHNIAILRLAAPLDFYSNFVLRQTCFPFPMNTSLEMKDNITLAVVGWTAFNHSNASADKQLQQMIVHPIDSNDSFCERSVADNKLLICAGSYSADIGVGLFQWTADHWELVGIESYTTDGSLRGGYKGLFVRVSTYNKWIESNIHTDSSTNMTTPANPFSTYQCDRNTPCGCSYSDVVFRPTRIIGGENVIDGSWSMIVSLRFYESEEHSCAGTLLSESFVLTAAHCVDHFLSTRSINITVVAGVTSRSDSDGYQRRVEKIHIHPNYTGSPLFLNNIALLQIDHPLYFQNNPLLAKTCAHRTNSSISINEQHPKDGTRLVVIGWGTMRLGSFVLSDYLRQVQVNAIDHQDPICQNAGGHSELQFCAGSYNVEKGDCLGDSGGPILYWTGRYWEQVGIIGNNFHCGRPGYPGVYTRLSYYWQWMEDILNAKEEYLEPQNPSPFSTTTRLPITKTLRPTTSRSTTVPESTTSNSSMPSSISTTNTLQPTTDTISVTQPGTNITSMQPTTTPTSETQSGTNTTTIQSTMMTTSVTQPGTNTTSTELTTMATNVTQPGTSTTSIELTTMATNVTQPGTNTTSTGLTTTTTSEPQPVVNTTSGTQPGTNITSTQPTTTTTSESQPVVNTTSGTQPGTNTTNIELTTMTTNVTQPGTNTTSGPQPGTNTTSIQPTTTITSELQPSVNTTIGTQPGTNTTSIELTTMATNVTQPGTNTTSIELTTMATNVTQSGTNTTSGPQPGTNTTSIQPTTMITSELQPSVNTTIGTQPGTNTTSIELTTMATNVTQSGTNSTSGPQPGTNTTSIQPTTMITSELQPSVNVTIGTQPGTNTTSIELTTMATNVTQSGTNTTSGPQPGTNTTSGPQPETNTTSIQPTTMITSGLQPSVNTTIGTQPGTDTTSIQSTTMTTSDLQTTTTTSNIQPTTMTTSNMQTAATKTANGTLPEVTSTVIGSQTAMKTTKPLSPQNTATAMVPLTYRTYECSRSSDQCGCSLANVILPHNNQQWLSRNDSNEDAHPYSWSMIVSIRINATKHLCTGTVLSDSFILTAAHCVANQSIRNGITVAAGIHSLSQYVTSTRRIDQVHVHENYTTGMPHLHDVAILHLEQPLELKTQPLFAKTCLSNSKVSDSTAVSPLVSVGWKYPNIMVDEENTVQQVSVKLINNPNATCFNSPYNDIYQFCAGLWADRTCQERFGEPIFVYRGNYWEQVGILSQAYGCAPTGHSGIYIRLSAYTTWIQKIMKSTPIPTREPPPLPGSTASTLQQNMIILNILLFLIKQFS